MKRLENYSKSTIRIFRARNSRRNRNDGHGYRYVVKCDEIPGYCGYGLTISDALVRTVTDDWLKCKDCPNYRPTLDTLLYAKYKFGDPKLKLRDVDIAERVGAKDVVYEQDYRFQSDFVHPSHRSLAILTDPETSEARTAPAYDNILFLACCESFIRSALRMTEFMEAFLSKVSKAKADAWRRTAGKPCKEAADWLKATQEKYGSEK